MQRSGKRKIFEINISREKSRNAKLLQKGYQGSQNQWQPHDINSEYAGNSVSQKKSTRIMKIKNNYPIGLIAS